MSFCLTLQSELSVRSDDQTLLHSAKNSVDPHGGDQTTMFCLYSLFRRLQRGREGSEIRHGGWKECSQKLKDEERLMRARVCGGGSAHHH